MKKDNKTNRRLVYPILAVFFLDCFAFSISFPLFAALFAHPALGIFAPQLPAFQKHLYFALLLSIFPLAQFICAPFIGDFADRFGRKKVLLISLVGSAIGSFFSFTTLVFTNYWLLLFSRLFTGLFSANISIAITVLTDVATHSSHRSKLLGMGAFINGAGWISGIFLGATLTKDRFIELYSPAFAFLFVAFLFLIGSLYIHFFFFEKQKGVKKREKYNLFLALREMFSALKDKQRQQLYWCHLFWVFGWNITFQWYAIYAFEVFGVEVSKASYIQFLNGFAGMLGSYFINQLLLKRLETKPIALVAVAAAGLCVLTMALAQTFFLFAAFSIIACIPAAIAGPNILNLLSLTASHHNRGKVMGFAQSIDCLANVVAALLGGLVGAVLISYLYFFAFTLILISLFLCHRQFIKAL